MSILVTIICIGFVIFVHELGHLLAAKRAKVGVSEFAIGMGPKIVSYKAAETLYSLRAFPIGGFIRAKGLDDVEDCPIEEDYREKSILARASIIVAGSVMNLLLGLVMFFLIAMIVGQPNVTNKIEQVLDDYPAQLIGLKEGDEIIKVNDEIVGNITSDFINKVQSSNGEELNITYIRDGIESTATMSAILSESNQYVIGVSFQVVNVQLSIIDSISYGINKTLITMGQTFIGLKMLVSGQANVKDLAGPVGIIQIASSQLSSSITSFFGLMAFISISLGVINLFPFPVLDGGHLLFLLIEAVRGKPLNKSAEIIINNAATVLLVSLMIFIIFNDVLNWSERVEIIKELNK